MNRILVLLIAIVLIVFGLGATGKVSSSHTRKSGTTVIQDQPGTHCTRLQYPAKGEMPEFNKRCKRLFAGAKKGEEFLPNNPPSVALSTSSADFNKYSDSPVRLSARASDSDNDGLLYTYSSTAGRIEGEGANADWKLTMVEPGTYTVSLEVDDGCGCISFTSTMVKVGAYEPKDDGEFYNRGSEREYAKQFDEAIADYAKAIELNPQKVSAYAGRGRALFGKKQFDESIADFTKAIGLDPKNTEAYINRGNALQAKSDLDRALADYTKVIELEPQKSIGYELRGLAQATAGHQQEAIADYTKGIEINPRRAILYAYKGIALTLQNNDAEAQTNFDTAIKLDVNLKSQIEALLPKLKNRRQSND
jgi:tetratricopeptide (TPR) repeat protein